MILSHKIQLEPNKQQIGYFKKACGTARFAYNWGLAKWQEDYKIGISHNYFSIKKLFNSIKKSQFPWAYEVSKCCSESSFSNLDAAFKNFFAKRAQFPRYKKKGIHDSFYLSNDQVRVCNNLLKIPKLSYIKMTEQLRFKGTIQSAVILRIADKWFVSISIEMSESPYTACENQEAVGVDLGIKSLATLSTGVKFEPLRALYKNEKSLKRLQRQLSRKQKSSKNRLKARMKVAKKYYRVRCLRTDYLHKLTTFLTENYRYISIENLNVAGMVQNRHLSKSISDCAFGEFKRQLEYKSKLRDNTIFIADRFFPSSKKCSCCGNIKQELSLSERVYKCEICGAAVDRDVNAALNLKQLLSTGGLSETAYANVCGDHVRPDCQCKTAMVDEAEIINMDTFIHI